MPKINLALQSMEIDPSDQKLQPLEALFSWQKVIDDKVIIQSMR
jgi:hypothetical protein